MPFLNQISARQTEPQKYKKFRRENNKFGNGIDAIWGILDDGKVELQSIRFDAKLFSEDKAKKWLKEHDMKTDIESAKEDEKMSEISIEEIYNDEYEDITGIEILNTFWNTKGIKFDEEILDEFANNYEKYKAQKTPHVKINHTQQQEILKVLTGQEFEEGTELPNLGLVSKMYRNGKSLFADLTRVPKKLKDIIFGDKMFKAVSPEATWNFRDTGDKLITSLVMTNNPAQKHILDVHMNENTTDVTGKASAESMALHFSGEIIIDGGAAMATEKDVKDVKIEDEKSFSEKVGNVVKDFFKKVETPAAEGTVTLSEYKTLEKRNIDMMGELNTVKLQLIEKDNMQKEFSERLAAMESSTRKENAEAISKQAILDGVPPVVVEYFRPLLLSEMGEKKIKLSEKIDDKIVEAEKPVREWVKGFFKMYPNKINFSDRMTTKLEEPDEDENLELSEINKKKSEYMRQGMKEFDALEKAGLEVLASKKRR
jgi:hypothetical protein